MMLDSFVASGRSRLCLGVLVQSSHHPMPNSDAFYSIIEIYFYVFSATLCV